MTLESDCLFGVNLPWLFGSYGHDMAPNELHPDWGSAFDVFRSYRPLIDAREMGFAAVRVWLCEKGEGIVTRDGRIDAVHPELLGAVGALQECAKLAGLKVYWTLLDANSWAREGDRLTGSAVADAEQSARFAERVARPIVRALDPAITLAVEVLNEPEALTAACVPKGHDAIEWAEIGRFVRTVGDVVRDERPGTVVTTGALAAYLRPFLASDPRLDAIDVHAYHATGGLPSRAVLARDANDDRLLDPSLALIAGECGMPDGCEEMAHMKNYLFNAASLGYSAAFMWRLEQVLLDAKDPARRFTEVGQMLRGQLKDG